MTSEFDQRAGVDTLNTNQESHKRGKDISEILNDELKRLGNGELLATIRTALEDDWLKRKNRLRPDKESNENVRKCLSENDLNGAILAVMPTVKEPVLHGSLTRTTRNLRAKISAATSGEEKPIFIKGKPSTTFVYGGAAHALCEPIKACRNLNSLGNGKFTFDVRDGEIVGMKENPKITPPQLDLKMDVGKPEQNDKKGKLHSVRNNSSQEPRHVEFEYPIRPPYEGQSRHDWAINIFIHSFIKIKKDFGFLPEKPFDVEQIFKNEESLQALMESLEAAHILFGVDHGLDMVEWNGNNGTLESKNVGEFPVLDWMAVMRNTLDLVSGNERLGDEDGVLIEIPEGDILVSSSDGNGGNLSEKIRGNKIDIMRLSWKDKDNNSENDNWKSSMSLKTAVEYISGKFYSQESKYRKTGVVKGKVQDVVTMNFRNVRSLFKELYEIYGERIFTDLEIHIDDLKFPAGDGGWFQQYNPNFLPERKHVEQVSGYLFKVMAQLFWVKKLLINREELQLSELTTSDDIEKINNIDNFSINVDEVAKFIDEYNLCDRIKGRLLYQLPGSEICKTVSLESNIDEIIRRGSKVFDIASKLDKRNTLYVLQTITSILRSKINNLTVVEKEVKTLPEEMKELCVENDAGIFLCIEKLSNLLREKMIEGNLRIENMVSLVDKDMRVIWIKNLLDKIPLLRITIDKNGKYSVFYDYEENSIHFYGRLLSSVKMRGVSEKADNLSNLYMENVWNMVRDGLDFPELSSLENMTVNIKDKDWIIFPDGHRERKVSGKPVVCLWNPMGGSRWYLDAELLKKATENDASHRDTWGFNQLAELANTKYKGKVAVLCPMPTHENIDKTSKAGHWYGDERDGLHIMCFGGCKKSIDLAPILEMEHSIIYEPIAAGETINDFRQVSRERQKTFKKTLEFGALTEKYSGVATRYLIEERGLSPEDIGEYGYVPVELVEALTRLVESDGFKNLRKSSQRVEIKLNSMAYALRIYSIQDPMGEAESAINEAMQFLENVKPIDRDDLFSILTINTLTEMHRRGIFQTRSEEHRANGDEVDARLGGRIILPTYFVDPSKSGIDAFVRSNYIARGIVLDGQPLFGGHHQLKARIRQGKLVRDGIRLLDTPTGFWARDWEKLVMKVDSTKKIIVYEGPMDAGSLGRICPDYKDMGFANIGFNYHHLFPFLRFLGIRGDKYPENQGLHLNIENIYLAHDWDATGAKNFGERIIGLRKFFGKEIGRVYPIHKLLPQEVLDVVPPYNPKLYYKGEESGEQRGRFYGLKIDLNGLINAEAETNPALKPIRDKYAYKP